MTEQFKRPNDETPFREPLLPFEIRPDKIKLLKSRPDLIIKEWAVGKDKDNQRMHVDNLNRAKEYFKFLATKYSVRIPRYEYVLGKNKYKEPTIFIVSERVDGKDLMRREEQLPVESREEFDSFYAQMAQHYLDVYRDGGQFWDDFRNDQIVYGSRPCETEEHIYIVDIEPEIKTFNPGMRTDPETYRLMINVNRIAKSIAEAEEKFKPAVKLKRARHVLKTLLENLSSGDKKNNFILDAREILELP